MTVQELIHLLEQIEDKTKEVRDGEYGDSSGCGSRWLFVAFVRKCENGGFDK